MEGWELDKINVFLPLRWQKEKNCWLPLLGTLWDYFSNTDEVSQLGQTGGKLHEWKKTVEGKQRAAQGQQLPTSRWQRVNMSNMVAATLTYSIPNWESTILSEGDGLWSKSGWKAIERSQSDRHCPQQLINWQDQWRSTVWSSTLGLLYTNYVQTLKTKCFLLVFCFFVFLFQTMYLILMSVSSEAISAFRLLFYDMSRLYSSLTCVLKYDVMWMNCVGAQSSELLAKFRNRGLVLHTLKQDNCAPLILLKEIKVLIYSDLLLHSRNIPEFLQLDYN